MNRSRQKGGFTIIEVIIVVVVLAILAAILIPNFRGIRQDSKSSAAQADLRTIQTAIEAYINEKNTPPAYLTNLLYVAEEDRVVGEVPTDLFSTSSADYGYHVKTSFTSTSYYIVHSVGANGSDETDGTEYSDALVTQSECGDDLYVTNARQE
jgi:prepilin-type N-terminal cleavage/methylation domain-containing protein